MQQVVLTIPEVSEMLRISLRSAYQMAQDGKLPGAVKVGNQWRISREQLMDWLASSTPEKKVKPSPKGKKKAKA